MPDDNTIVTLSDDFPAAAILELAARRATLDAEEHAAYGRYLFGAVEPATKAECRKALNHFLRRAAGQEPTEGLEKDFLVRAVQFYARKWNLALHFQDAAGAVPCRISTAPNRDQKYARAFRLVEPGRQGRTLASRNALPDLTFRP